MKYNYARLLLLVLAGAFSVFSYGQTVFTYSGTIETYTVPPGVSNIQIECWGAQGAGDNGTTGGLGAYMSGTFAVTPGQELKILVGGQGSADPGSINSAGGGGGSFVTDLSDNPWIIAGGGGGTNGTPMNGDENAPVTNNGLNGYSPSNPSNYGVGGTAGNGATMGPSTPCAGNGGGLLTDGAPETCCGDSDVGIAFVNGGTAAASGGCGTSSPGGFGGGGAGGSHGCGGGGGYSGGGANYHHGGNGGGGGSYNDGTDQVNIAGDNSGDGQIVITELCDGLVATVSSDTVCETEQIILSAESTNGGTVTWDSGIENDVPFYPASTGTVTYTASSDNEEDCDFVIDIFVMESPNFTLTANDELVGGDGAVYTTLESGIFPLTYDWDNDGTGDFDDPQNLIGLSSGTYTVTVMQADGCTRTDSATVSSQLGVETEEIVLIEVYPNPTKDQLTINYSGAFSYNIINVLGEVVMIGKGKDQTSLSVEKLSKGTYTVQLTSDDRVETVQFVKQ
ncbi:MAG: T9SS type A sorting domain-containing protein [Flavobacteriales bacterium]|nr:T9SS type A sorting domain-containing protein [Flavobacteriales bacterium]